MLESTRDQRSRAVDPGPKAGPGAAGSPADPRARTAQAATKRKFGSNSISFGSGVTPKELVTFTRQFATMIDAGLPLVQCLRILAGQQRNQVFGNVLQDVRATVEQGTTFSDALKRHPKIFDELYVNLVQTGEVGGILDTVLNRLANYIEKRLKLISQVRGALAYPSIVMVILVGIVTVLLVFVIPAFENLFADFGGQQSLPKLTQAVIWFSRAFVGALPIIIPITILINVAAVWFYRTPKGKTLVHKTLLKIPVLGTVLQKSAVARFCRTLSTLLHSGVPILDGLEVCAKSAGNVVITAGIMFTRTKVSEGQNLADPLMEAKVFPHMVVQMISVGEQTGSLDNMLEKVADFYEDEVDVAVAALTSLLEPLLMVVVGLVVGVVLLAMYLPIFSMAGAIKE